MDLNSNNFHGDVPIGPKKSDADFDLEKRLADAQISRASYDFYAQQAALDTRPHMMRLNLKDFRQSAKNPSQCLYKTKPAWALPSQLFWVQELNAWLFGGEEDLQILKTILLTEKKL